MTPAFSRVASHRTRRRYLWVPINRVLQGMIRLAQRFRILPSHSVIIPRQTSGQLPGLGNHGRPRLLEESALIWGCRTESLFQALMDLMVTVTEVRPTHLPVNGGDDVYGSGLLISMCVQPRFRSNVTEHVLTGPESACSIRVCERAMLIGVGRGRERRYLGF